MGANGGGFDAYCSSVPMIFAKAFDFTFVLFVLFVPFVVKCFSYCSAQNILSLR